VVSSHYVLLKDAFARHCTKDRKLFQVFVDGKLRVLIDMSHPRGIEGISTEYGQDDIDYYQRFVGDLISQRPMMPSEMTTLLQATAQATKNVADIQEVFNANMASHIKAVQELGIGVAKLNKLIEKLNMKL
jgi:hypothetical protein